MAVELGSGRAGREQWEERSGEGGGKGGEEEKEQDVEGGGEVKDLWGEPLWHRQHAGVVGWGCWVVRWRW
jgi:hypothetical protein